MDDSDWKIVGTSLGFSVFSASAATGGSLRLRPASWAQTVGVATLIASGLAFVLLVAGLWFDSDGDGVWQAWGIASLMALWGSHASVVLRPLRASDASAIRWLSGTAIVSLGIDAWIGVLAILEVFEDAASDPMQRVLAATVILTLLSSALVVILRRMTPTTAGGTSPSPAADAFGAARPRGPGVDLPAEIAAVAARLDALPPSPEIRSAVMRLRELAEHASG
jgi:cytochrome c biogenesis protein CcdA